MSGLDQNDERLNKSPCCKQKSSFFSISGFDGRRACGWRQRKVVSSFNSKSAGKHSTSGPAADATAAETRYWSRHQRLHEQVLRRPGNNRSAISDARNIIRAAVTLGTTACRARSLVCFGQIEGQKGRAGRRCSTATTRSNSAATSSVDVGAWKAPKNSRTFKSDDASTSVAGLSVSERWTNLASVQ